MCSGDITNAPGLGYAWNEMLDISVPDPFSLHRQCERGEELGMCD